MWWLSRALCQCASVLLLVVYAFALRALAGRPIAPSSIESASSSSHLLPLEQRRKTLVSVPVCVCVFGLLAPQCGMFMFIRVQLRAKQIQWEAKGEGGTRIRASRGASGFTGGLCVRACANVRRCRRSGVPSERGCASGWGAAGGAHQRSDPIRTAAATCRVR